MLKTITARICSAVTKCHLLKPMKQTISFGKAGEKPGGTSKAASGFLNTVDWLLSVELGRQLDFPQHVAKTTLRPDIVLISEAAKNMVLLELTVPWEDWMEEAFEQKRECHRQGWKAKAYGSWVQRLCRAVPL